MTPRPPPDPDPPPARGADDILEALRRGEVDAVVSQSAVLLLRVHEAKAAREASEARLRLALEAARMGTWEWHLPSGRFACSAALEALLGLAPGTFPGTAAAFLARVHPDDRDRFRGIPTGLGGEGGGETELRLVWPDGSLHWLTLTGRPLAGEAATLAGVAMDVTARWRAVHETEALKDALARHLQSLIRLHEVSTRFVHDGDVPEFLEQVLETAMAVTGADFGNIQLLDPESGRLAIAAQRGFPQDFLTFFRHVEAGHATCGTAMAHKRRVVVEDVATDPIFQGSPAREVMLAAGARAVQATPLLTRAGAVLGMLSTHFRTPHRPGDDELRLVDLCVRQAADLLESKRVEARLTASLREKEVLLRELHHRVKNNLQVVCSLLSLQRQGLQDRALQALFQESEDRIRAMALIHETLYQAPDVARFHLAPYLRTLGDYLLQSYGVDPRRITLTTHLDDLELPLDTAVPLGLVLHELLSNALKHAFPGGRAGDLRVALRATPAGQVTLRVADTGVGLPADLDVRQTASLGWQLVCALAEQLGGGIAVERAGGTTVTLTFPCPPAAAG